MSDAIEAGSTELILTDAGVIHDETLAALESHIKEPLFPGDERRMFGEALAAVLGRVYGIIQDAAHQSMLRFARGEVLDAIAARLGVVRLTGAPAKCILRFSLAAPSHLDITIPKWTKVTADGDIFFATDAPAVIEAGSLTCDVHASCTAIGTNGNDFGVNSLTTLVDLIPYIAGVTNITTSDGGDDGEPYTEEGDNRLRERVLLAPAKLSTAGPEQGYVYWAKTADSRIVDVYAMSDTETLHKTVPVVGGIAYMGGDLLLPETLLVNGSAPDGWEYDDGLLKITVADEEVESVNVDIGRKMDGRVKVVPLLAGGEIPGDEVLEAVYDTINAKDVRPMTDVVSVVAPMEIEYDIELTYWTTPAEESECIETVEGPNGAIARYVSEQCSVLGRDINPDILKTMCMRPDWGEGLAGAIRCEVAEPQYMPVAGDEVAHWSGQVRAVRKIETQARWS